MLGVVIDADGLSATVWVSGAELLEVLLSSPPYAAVIVRALAGSEPVVQLATPAVSGRLAHPVIDVPPSLKSTVPVGLSPLTVAVNVTECPGAEGFGEEPSAVLLCARGINPEPSR